MSAAQQFDAESHFAEPHGAEAARAQVKTDGVPPTTAAMGLRQHPLSAAFPAMPEEDFQALKDSIENIGVQNPITLHEGMVVDGWHRYRAATELCMPCPAIELGDVDPRDFVKAQNKARRNLSASQWALIEVTLWNWKSAGKPTNPAAAAGFHDAPKTTAQLAELAGVSARTIGHAKVVESAGAEVVKAAVSAGEVSVERAAAIAKLPKDEQAAALGKPCEKKLRKKIAEPTPEEKAAAEEAAAAHEAAFGDANVAQLLTETQADLEAAQRLIAAMSADDAKAETAKWQRISEVSNRRQNEIQQALVDREKELKRLMNIVRRIGRLVGEDDPSRVAAVVEARLRCTESSE